MSQVHANNEDYGKGQRLQTNVMYYMLHQIQKIDYHVYIRYFLFDQKREHAFSSFAVNIQNAL